MKHRTQFILRRIGRNLAQARHARHLTQAAVAAQIGMPERQYARLERGENDSGITRYLDAMWELGMSPDELLHRLDERIP